MTIPEIYLYVETVLPSALIARDTSVYSFPLETAMPELMQNAFIINARPHVLPTLQRLGIRFINVLRV